jgi:MFS transporter, PHS family, inorganic phosphate transporter
MSSAAHADRSAFAALDDAKPNRFQLKIMFVSGMGFFTDAYDLFVIGIVVKIVTDQWHLDSSQTALLASSTLAASAVGALVFGRIADMFGRKRIYGLEVLILAAGAIASAFAPNITWLIIFRCILGIGIGGDYPVSATIMSEYAGTKSRGRLVGLVFSMQAAGLIFGPLFAVLLLGLGIKDGTVWRILLGFGAVPGLAVFYLRRQIHETPRFALAGGDTDEMAAAIAQATTGTGPPPKGESTAVVHQSFTEGWAKLVNNSRLLKWLVGAATCWFLLDFAYYGNTIAAPEIVSKISPTATLIQSTLITLCIFVVFALPGYVLAIAKIETIGRKKIQTVGFGVMAGMFLLIAVVPSVSANVVPFVLVFGISYLFTEFGPNTTTFIYPAEIFPTEVRTTAHGISAGMGKLGAFVGVYLLTDNLNAWGIRTIEGVCAGVAVAGLLLTVACLPEPAGKSLEDLEAEAKVDFGRVVAVPAVT